MHQPAPCINQPLSLKACALTLLGEIFGAAKNVKATPIESHALNNLHVEFFSVCLA